MGRQPLRNNLTEKPDPQTLKVCVTCGEAKPHTSFHSHHSTKDGFRPDCKSCRSHKQSVRYARQAREAPEELLLQWARNRANKQNLPFDIIAADIHIPNFCPVLGIPLERGKGTGGCTHNSPSLDRIYPAKGYVKGNVIVISHRANTIKRDATPEELNRLAAFYSRYTR